LGKFDKAEVALKEAARLFHALGDIQGEVSALLNAGFNEVGQSAIRMPFHHMRRRPRS
jgi:hypothetical protein